MNPSIRQRVLALALVGAFVAGVITIVIAGGSPRRPAAVPTPTVTPIPVEVPTPETRAARSLVATATVPTVEIFDAPGGSVDRRLRHPTDVGGPLVFLVADERGRWLDVHLPVRPNGSRGWVRRRDVQLSAHRFRIVIRLAAHRIVVTKGELVMLDARVGVGTADTPTPGGLHYIKELLRPPNPNGLYGPYAYGLSGFSNELESFAGGDGVIGIHGTNDPSSIGRDVSHGCIRLRNRDIRQLVRMLPLGTPVEIRA